MKLDIGNAEDVKQLVRASGSVGANYIEENENAGPKDLVFRIKISRKESKESMHFSGLVQTEGNNELELEREKLIDEAGQLGKFFSTMLHKRKEGD